MNTMQTVEWKMPATATATAAEPDEEWKAVAAVVHAESQTARAIALAKDLAAKLERAELRGFNRGFEAGFAGGVEAGFTAGAAAGARDPQPRRRTVVRDERGMITGIVDDDVS